jgi:hypothetical protein
MRERIVQSRLGRLLLAALLLVVASPVSAWAAGEQPQASVPGGGPQVYGISQEDTNHDGALDLVTIDCNIKTPNDKVMVFDGSGTMRRSDRWQDATDFTDDTWIFDIGGNGGRNRATLIIAFSQDQGDTLARIYDGSTTRGGIRYEINGSSIHVINPVYPSLIIRVKGQWTRPDGGLNYNLIWQYDGPAANRDDARRYPTMFPLDGNPDATGAAGDTHGDGIPDYLWYSLLTPIQASERIPRSGAQVNSGRHRPASLTNVVFWPLLNQPDDPKSKNYFDTPLFLGVDWTSGLIESFSFQGYPVEDGYHINSLDPLKPKQVNVLSFENPMAYYDLAGNHNGIPELFIRFAYTPPGATDFMSGGPTRSPMEMVQYSWNQQNHDALRWDYKVDLAGRNPITTTVSLGDMRIQQVPHDILPRWVMENPWGFATFVAYESGDGYLSSEGLYEWSTLEGVQSYGGMSAGSTLAGVQAYTGNNIQTIPNAERSQRDYLGGASAISPQGLYQSILAGFRGEYANINGPVWLYFSPIDARLHLVGADHGVYNMGSRRVEYHNLSGGPFIDSWQVYLGSQIVGQLQQSRDFLLSALDGKVSLLRAAVPRELFRTQPPASHDEWVKLGAQLDANKRDLAPIDLTSMMGQFAGPQITISNADMTDYRPLGDAGFRFVLDLQPGYRTEGADLLPLAGLAPGKYVITYQGSFTIEPLTPPVVSGAVVQAELTQLQPGTVAVALRNDGLQDIPSATLELWAAPVQGQSALVVTQTVALLAQTPITATIQWAAPANGVWSLTPQIRQPDGKLITFKAAEVHVFSGTSALPVALISATSAQQDRPVVLLGLLACAALAAISIARQERTTRVKRGNRGTQG